MKFILNEDLRELLKRDFLSFDRGQYTLQCHMGVWEYGSMGVWDEGVASVTEDISFFIQDREYSCFFTPCRKSMLLPAAIEIQKREEENRKLKRTNTYTMIGLWLAGLGLMLNAIVTIYQAIKCL